MSDPLDLDALRSKWQSSQPDHDGDVHPMTCSLCAMNRLVAELRTARAERDAIAAEKKQLRGHASELIVLRDALRAERDALAVRIEAAEHLHTESVTEGSGWCSECALSWPCRTHRALSGATEPAEETR